MRRFPRECAERAQSHRRCDVRLAHFEFDRGSEGNRGTKIARIVDAVFEILVDFCFRNSLSMTLVSRRVPIDHHFFLDFIFH